MNAYGQTESTSSISFLGPDDHRLDGRSEDVAVKEHRLRSVGKVMPDIEVLIMDPADQVVGTGEEGEICVRGDRIMPASTTRRKRPPPRFVTAFCTPAMWATSTTRATCSSPAGPRI